jgi:hypothetical protein
LLFFLFFVTELLNYGCVAERGRKQNATRKGQRSNQHFSSKS